MKLIDKDALVAEIESYKNSFCDRNGYLEDRETNGLAYDILCELEDSIDTLEVKEVDLEFEIKKIQKEYKTIDEYDGYPATIYASSIERIAKHFFELGLRASQPTTSAYGIEEALKENGIDPDSKEADVYREAIYKIYDRLKAQKGEEV